jgi:hypothetical protein
MPKFLNNIDLTQNQIINIVIERRTGSDGSGVEGQIIYRTDTDVIKYYDGTNWITLASSSSAVNSVTAGDGLVNTGTANDPVLDVNVDGSTIEIVGNVVRIRASGVGTNELNDASVTTIKVADANITFAKIQDLPTMTVIGRVAAGTGVSSAITVLTSTTLTGADNTNLATAGAIKTYIDNTIAGLGTLQGGFDANAATNFPSGSSQGDYWYVTVAGTVQGINLDIGDVLIANINSASTTNPADWTFLETNREQANATTLGVVRLATTAEVNAGTENQAVVVPSTLSARTATETRTGLAEIATQAETDAGTDDNRIVTPLKLATYVGNALSQNYAVSIGNGSSTSYTITHSLASLDVVVEVFANSNGETVYPDIFRPNSNDVQIVFSVAPTSNQYRVVVKKL